MQNQDIVRIIIAVCLLLAAWPYACLAYLGELKKISRELVKIRIALEEKKCKDTSTEQIG